MLKHFPLFLGLILLLSCENKTSQSTYLYPNLGKPKIISTDKLTPNSYQFSSVPRKHKNNYYYLDRNLGRLIVLDNNFDFVKSILVRGDDPNLLKTIYETSIAGDFFFFMGNNLLVVDMNTQEKYGPFSNPFEFMQDAERFGNGFLTGHVKDGKNYMISYFELDLEKGIKNVSDKVEIDFEEGVSPLDMSGHLEVFDQSIVFVKDWSGEAYSFNHNFIFKNRKQLDFSGNLELNKNVDEKGISYFYFQAYSITKTSNNLLAVMREIDFEEHSQINLKDVDEELVRKKIHLFDEKLNYKGGIKLKYFSTDIHFYDDKLLTLNYEDELVFSYTLSK
ncbi:MAG: hypothetical protein ACI85I_001185 [Arenicella sp.]|jgi:hypothetical protein